MPYLTPEEINTHIDPDVQDEISPEDSGFLQDAIDAAEAEVYGYLTNYDTDAIFTATGDDRNPIILLYTKDVAVWHYIQLANPNIDIALRERRYEMAKESLTQIQTGKMVPKLPRRVESTETPQANSEVRYGSSRPRNKGFL